MGDPILKAVGARLRCLKLCGCQWRSISHILASVTKSLANATSERNGFFGLVV